MTKTCRLCQTTDPTSFYETQTTNLCRPCFRATYYEPGRQRLLQSKLDRKSCLDCGLEVTPMNGLVFDYDHRGDKRIEVSRLCYAPAAVFQEELAKCDLVCSNCHRLRTQARGFFRGGGRPRKFRAPSTLDPAPFSLGTS